MTWQDDYRKTVLDSIVKMGAIPEPGAVKPYEGYLADCYSEDEMDTNVYGWRDYTKTREANEHFLQGGCTPYYGLCGDVTEQRWSQFEDTDSDDSQHHGLDARITCVCGKYTNEYMRWEGSTSSIVQAVLREALKAPSKEGSK